jgi:hypothetical protein
MVRSSQHSLGLCEVSFTLGLFTHFQIRRSPTHPSDGAAAAER